MCICATLEIISELSYILAFVCVLNLDHPLFSNILIKSVYAEKAEITVLSTELEVQNINGRQVDGLAYR
jgi:hypothetical protein